MTDLNRLGEELRAELGDPPASWTDRQRLRLRGLDLESRDPDRRPVLLAAALALGTITAAFFYLAPSSSSAPIAANTPQSSQQEAKRAAPTEPQDSRPKSKEPMGGAVWLEAGSESSTHRLADGSVIEVAPGGRGRLDQGPDFGTRFDLHDGTASFDVRKQKAQPFVVVAGEFRVRVVGTRFQTVYAPPRELSVAVDEGAVQVDLPQRSEPVTVEAGEVLDASGREFSLHEMSDEDTGAFVNPGNDGPDNDNGSGADEMSWQRLYFEGKYRQACAGARKNSFEHLKTQLSAEELVHLADALRLCGDTNQALATLQSLRQRYASSTQAHDALFLVGRIHANSEKAASAISQFEKYLNAGKGGRFSTEALGRLIELHGAQGNREKARDYATRYLRRAPHGPYRRLAESVIGNP